MVGRLCAEIGRDVVREIALEFLGDLDAALPELQRSCEAQDRQHVAATAHKLKSPARSLGAVGLGDLLGELEQQAADSDWPTLNSLVGRLVSQRSGVHEQLRAELAP